jgi:hypothetical protein
MNQLHFDLNTPRRSMGYLSGPMSAELALDRALNRFKAIQASTQLWEAAILHYCPHAASPAIGSTDVDYETWMAMDIEILRRCDWILLLDDWAKSEGCRREFNVAMNLGIPVAYSVEEAIALARELDRRIAVA